MSSNGPRYIFSSPCPRWCCPCHEKQWHQQVSVFLARCEKLIFEGSQLRYSSKQPRQVSPRSWRRVQGGVFSSLLQCPLLPAPLTLERCVPWLHACSFLRLPTRAALYRLSCIPVLLGALEPDTVPAAGAELSAMVGDCRGDTSISKGRLGLLPDF